MFKERAPYTDRHPTEAALTKLAQLLAQQMAREACHIQPAAIVCGMAHTPAEETEQGTLILSTSTSAS